MPGQPDLVLVLEDPFGTIATSDDNGGGGTNPRLNNVALTASGTHTVVVTNVPGPQHTLYAADARMLSTYPVMPLARGQGLSIGLTSYDGGVYYGLNADRDSMPDVDVLGQGIVDSLAELLESHRSKR